MTIEDIVWFLLHNRTWWAIYAVCYVVTFAIMIARARHVDSTDYFTLGIGAIFWPVFMPFVLLGAFLHAIIEAVVDRMH